MPTALRRHNISDEELEMLKTSNRDGLSEAFWAFAGAGIAGIPSTIVSLGDAYAREVTVPLSGLNLFGVIVTLICVALAIAIKVIDVKRGTRAGNLIEEIRNRPAR